MYSRFAAHYERIFPFRDGVFSFLHSRLVPDDGRVLDVGCGPGHYCGAFASRGATARGIDLDEGMIAAAQARYPQASFARRSMTDLEGLDGPLDLAFCIGNVAAHVDVEAFDGMIATIGRLLRPGGTWVVQTVNWDRHLARDSFVFPPRRMDEEDFVFLREYRDLSEDGVRFHTELRKGEVSLFREEVGLFPVRAQRYIGMHEAAGFTLEDHFSDFAGTPFDPVAGGGSVLVFRNHEP